MYYDYIYSRYLCFIDTQSGEDINCQSGLYTKLNEHRQVGGEVVCFKQNTVLYALMQTAHAWHFFLVEKVPSCSNQLNNIVYSSVPVF